MWIHLTPTDLETHLAQDEIDKLQQMSLSTEAYNKILQTTLDQVADAFRGAWQSKGFSIDIREHYVAPEYVKFILDYARYAAWSRFPLSESYGLGEDSKSSPRQKAYDEAVELLRNPYIGVSRPDYSTDPDLSGRTDLTATNDNSIKIPFQRFPSEIWQYGFPQVFPPCVRS